MFGAQWRETVRREQLRDLLDQLQVDADRAPRMAGMPGNGLPLVLVRSICAGRADVAFGFAVDRRPGPVQLFGVLRNAEAVSAEVGDLDLFVFKQIAGTDLTDARQSSGATVLIAAVP